MWFAVLIFSLAVSLIVLCLAINGMGLLTP